MSKSSTSKPIVVHREKLKLYCSDNAQAAVGGDVLNDVTTAVQPNVVDVNADNSQQSTHTVLPNNVYDNNMTNTDNDIDLDATQPYSVAGFPVDVPNQLVNSYRCPMSLRPRRKLQQPIRFRDFHNTGCIYRVNSLSIACSNPCFDVDCSGPTLQVPLEWPVVSPQTAASAGEIAAKDVLESMETGRIVGLASVFQDRLSLPIDAAITVGLIVEAAVKHTVQAVDQRYKSLRQPRHVTVDPATIGVRRKPVSTTGPSTATTLTSPTGNAVVAHTSTTASSPPSAEWQCLEFPLDLIDLDGVPWDEQQPYPATSFGLALNDNEVILHDSATLRLDGESDPLVEDAACAAVCSSIMAPEVATQTMEPVQQSTPPLPASFVRGAYVQPPRPTPDTEAMWIGHETRIWDELYGPNGLHPNGQFLIPGDHRTYRWTQSLSYGEQALLQPLPSVIEERQAASRQDALMFLFDVHRLPQQNLLMEIDDLLSGQTSSSNHSSDWPSVASPSVNYSGPLPPVPQVTRPLQPPPFVSSVVTSVAMTTVPSGKNDSISAQPLPQPPLQDVYQANLPSLHSAVVRARPRGRRSAEAIQRRRERAAENLRRRLGPYAPASYQALYENYRKR